MSLTEQEPLDTKFSEAPPEFKKIARHYFYKILPLLLKEFTVMQEFGAEASLEAFELLVEEGGVKFIKNGNSEWHVILFNLCTGVYEDITTLKEELEEDNDYEYS